MSRHDYFGDKHRFDMEMMRLQAELAAYGVYPTRHVITKKADPGVAPSRCLTHAKRDQARTRKTPTNPDVCADIHAKLADISSRRDSRPKSKWWPL